MAKNCPECKSANTRQMDRDHYGDEAYCLSCYCRFRSKHNAEEVKSVVPKDRNLLRITERLERIERSLKIAQKDLLDLTKSTEA